MPDPELASWPATWPPTARPARRQAGRPARRVRSAPRAVTRRQMPTVSMLPYLPGLDGMRGLAVVAVMIYHANSAWLPGGFIGVEVFFVISGYLITLLLIGEHERTGRVSLVQFWRRRARRLLPALVLLLVALMSYTAIFRRDQLGALRGDVLAGLGYVTNWYQIWTGQGYTAAAEWAPLRHLWSLAVEEQFYLVWPVVMALLLRFGGRRRLPNVSRWLLIGVLAIAIVTGLLIHTGREVSAEITPEAYWRVFGRDVSKLDTLYLSTISRATGLMIGAAFAMLWRPIAVMRGPVRRKGWAVDLLALFGLGALVLLAWRLHLVTASGPDPLLFRGGLIAVDLATVLVIAAVTHSKAFTGPILGNPLFRWIGTRSYGLYLYHWTVYQIMRRVAGNALSWREFAAAMAITVVITEVSYRLVEWPIRARRMGRVLERLRQNRDPVPRRIIGVGAAASVALVAFAGASLATARLRPNEVETSLEAGGDFVTQLGGPSGDGPAGGGPAGAPEGGEPGPPVVPAGSEPAETTEPDAAATTEPEASASTDADAATTEPEAASTTEPEAAETTEPERSAPRPPTTQRPAAPARPTTTEPPATTPPPTTTLPPTTTTTTTTTTTVPPTTAPPTTPVPTPAPTLHPPLVQAIGDSVMLGAAENLAGRGVQVDAQVSRQMRDMVPVVQELAASGRLGDVVVVHLGTNGSFSESTMTAFFDALKNVPRVLVLTIHADRGYTARNNELILSLPGRFGNVEVIDWNALVNSCPGDCLYDDGIHLPPDGRGFYAQLIVDAIGL